MASEQENIPVLTQVYAAAEQPVLTPAFFEFAMEQLKPQLEKALAQAALSHQNETIKKEILDELRPSLSQELQSQMASSLKVAQQDLIRDTGDFIDKAKADLATEVPQIYLARAEIFQADTLEKLGVLQEELIVALREEFEQVMPQLEGVLIEKVNARLLDLQTSTIEKVTDTLQQKVTEFHEATLEKMRQDLARDLPEIYQAIMVQAKESLTHQLSSLQEDASQELGVKMNETLPSIYALASMQIKTDLFAEMSGFAQTTKQDFENALKGEVPELEQLLKDRIHQAFADELPSMRQEISSQVNSEIEAMIRSVRLVTSHHPEDAS
jgi:predicted peroxiredoxin